MLFFSISYRFCQNWNWYILLGCWFGCCPSFLSLDAVTTISMANLEQMGILPILKDPLIHSMPDSTNLIFRILSRDFFIYLSNIHSNIFQFKAYFCSKCYKQKHKGNSYQFRMLPIKNIFHISDIKVFCKENPFLSIFNSQFHVKPRIVDVIVNWSF